MKRPKGIGFGSRLSLSLVVMMMISGCMIPERGSSTSTSGRNLGTVEQVAMGAVGRIVVDRLPDATSLSPRSHGSGFLFRESIYFVTAAHNLRKKQSADRSYRIELGGRELEATVAAVDNRADVAILRLRRRPSWIVHPLMPTSGAEKIRRVFVMGFPYPELVRSKEPRVSTGIQSPGQVQLEGNPAAGRMLTCDACAGPGSSGGPVVDEYGRLVGVVTAILSTDGQWTGVTGFTDVRELDRLFRDRILAKSASESQAP